MVGVSLQELEAVSGQWLLPIQISVLQRDRLLWSSVRTTTQTDKLCARPHGPKGYTQMASGLGLNSHSFLHIETSLNMLVTCSTTVGWLWVSWKRVTLGTTTSGLTQIPMGGAAGNRFIWLLQVDFFIFTIFVVLFGIALAPSSVSFCLFAAYRCECQCTPRPRGNGKQSDSGMLDVVRAPQSRLVQRWRATISTWVPGSTTGFWVLCMCTWRSGVGAVGPSGTRCPV